MPIATPGQAKLQEPVAIQEQVARPEPATPIATPLRRRIIRIIPNSEHKEEEDIPEAENVTSVKSMKDKEEYNKRKDLHNEYIRLYESSGAMERKEKIRAEMEQLQGSRRFSLPKINTPSRSSLSK